MAGTVTFVRMFNMQIRNKPIGGVFDNFNRWCICFNVFPNDFWLLR